LNYQWANGWFAGTERGVGYGFAPKSAGPSPAVQYGVLLGADLGRKAGDSDRLKGMGDVDARPELGGFVSYALAPPLRLTSSLRYGSGNNSDGAQLNFNATYSMEVAPGWRASLNASTSLANASYMQSYFGVSQTQSGSSGYAVYSPGAGFKDVSGGLTLSYQLNPRTSINTGLSASALLGDARTSPLTQKPNSISGSLGLRYGF
jgi:outer membrane scaffolding protein for murein synthesis (MipA/OmpV family)